MLSKEDAAVAETVERLRKERGLTFRQLGELAGVHFASIHSFVVRGHSPSIPMICALGRALGFEVTLPQMKIRVLRNRAKATA